MNRYQIAIVIPKYGLIGGAERFASELTERVAQNAGYEVHVFANKWVKGPADVTFHKVPVIQFPRFLNTLSFAYFARREVSKNKFDLIHAHDRVFRADIFTMHGIPHRIWMRDIRKKRMRLADSATAWTEKKLVENKNTRRFLAVSDLVKEKFLEEYGHIGKDCVHTVHPGIDVSRFKGLDKGACRRELERSFGARGDDSIILFVGMNFDVKGLDALIMGLARFKERFPSESFRLLVIGKGDVKKYTRLAQNLGIAEKVIFPGTMPKELLEKIYTGSDLFCMLSKFDTFGMVVLEAMAAGLPVIISGNVGAKDIVKNGMNGFVVEDPGSPDKLADNIKVALEKERKASMVQEALRTAEENSWEQSAARVCSIYDEVLSGR